MMLIRRNLFNRLISLMLVVSILLMTVGCSNAPPTPTISDASPQTVTESVEIENVITENELHEFITTEIYLEEIVLAENKISELLLEEETITEVMCCKTIYVPQEHIEDFVENSQTTHLFGEGINIKSVLTKVAVGTGVIVTVVVLKKAGLPDPIASAVVAAADESLKFAGTGAALGSLFGGLTGATDELDETGRTSAVIGFATATAGLILSIVSLVAVVPSGGSTTITAAAGIKLVIAGISVLAATAGTAYAGYNAVKTFTSTDAADIDWSNVDWEKVGVSSAEKAIENASDGYMWGAIIGTVHGGAEGYEFYHKYNTPYSQYNARLVKTPVNGERGQWSGARGESDFVLKEPLVLSDGTKITKITYKNAVPDFSTYAKAEVKITMTKDRYSIKKDGIVGNFEKADQALAEHWTKIKYKGKSWTAREIAQYRTDNKLTWHEMNNMESIQLVPTDVNSTFGHLGGVRECEIMVGQEEVSDFD
ncbi:MAG: HNH endonuclease [Ruminococcus sp.]|nr:HNH endonuclease [Ruminococcus sp.]